MTLNVTINKVHPIITLANKGRCFFLFVSLISFFFSFIKKSVTKFTDKLTDTYIVYTYPMGATGYPYLLGPFSFASPNYFGFADISYDNMLHACAIYFKFSK